MAGGTDCASLRKIINFVTCGNRKTGKVLSKLEKYIVNPETLMAELKEEPRYRGWKLLAVFVSGAALFMLYLWIYVSVLGLDLPKTAILKRQNADWNSRIDRLSQQLDQQEERLGMLEVRDNRIYRSVYGMDEVPQAVRLAGLGGTNRYADLEGTSLQYIVRRVDMIQKRAYVQSKSFDDVAAVQRTAGDMAAHIPAIPPINTDPSTYRLTSPFGYRSDPILGIGKRHTGMDFACDPGNPIYAVGDGTVIKAAHEHAGYGNHIEIDHGFGYVTRYAHMSRLDVVEGQKVSRGDFLGLSGRSGRVTGPHLHFEVIYRKDYVNPALYMDLDIPSKDYLEMVKKPAGK